MSLGMKPAVTVETNGIEISFGLICGRNKAPRDCSEGAAVGAK